MSLVKPIEEAPRDGTYFLAISPRSMEFVNYPEGCCLGRWQEKRGSWSGVASWLTKPTGFVAISSLEEFLGAAEEKNKTDALIECISSEDEMIILHRGGKHVKTLYSSCPEQASDFVRLFRGGKLPTTTAWELTLQGHTRLWKPENEV